MGYCTKGLFLAGTSGLKVVVQPCTRRVFTDEEYEDCDILWPLWPIWWTLGWSVKIDPAMADSLYLEIIFSMIFWETYIYTIIYTVYNTSTNITLQPTQFLYVAACWKHAIRYPSLDLGRLIGFPFPLQGVRWCFRSAYGFVWNEDCWIEFAQCFSFLARGTPIRGQDQVILSHFCPCTGSWCWGRVGGGHCKASGIADCSKENPQ